MPYTSGMVCSEGKFAQRYGWFEIRARFPRGQGLRPAFWLLPASGAWPPEIDVLEILGHEPSAVHLTQHWRTESGRTPWSTTKFVGPDFSSALHTFAVAWEPVGGDMPGMPNAGTPFPATTEVDYIRVYRRAP